MKNFSYIACRRISDGRFWWLASLLWAAILNWDERHLMNPDGLSYLDMASAALSGGPGKLINGYWSPGYPALISVALLVFRPSPGHEFPVVHLVNFIVFAFALLAFSIFLRSWLANVELSGLPCDGSSRKYLVPFAFGTFAWFVVDFGACHLSTPDLCVNAIVFLIAAITCRLALPGSKDWHYLALGAAVGASYYMKSAMLILGSGFLGLMFVIPPNGVSRKKLLYSVVAFLFIATPLVSILSVRLGKPSFGETGQLNYAWYVNGVQDVGWTWDQRSIYGIPSHPPRILMAKPLTLEFASPVGGTYPLWSDPSYWNAGCQVRFDWHQQIAALKQSLKRYMDILTAMAPYIAGAIVLLFLSINGEALTTVPRRFWWQLAWPACACGMYALVHVESRFLSAFLVLFWLGTYAVLLLRLKEWDASPVLATVIAAAFVGSLGTLVGAAGRTALDFVRGRQPADYEIVAARLRNLGLHTGDRLALVGSAFVPGAYPLYARIDQMNVVAQIPDGNDFWSADSKQFESVEKHLSALGVKAIVAKDRPISSLPSNWQDINVSGGVHFSVLKIP
jgi:hypothetical protein